MRTAKKISSLLLAVLISITSIASIKQVYWGGVSVNGEGGGSTVGATGGGYTWSDANQGFRITIVDKSGNTVSAPVDILNTRPTQNIKKLWDSKLEGLEEFEKTEEGTPPKVKEYIFTRKTSNEVYYFNDILKEDAFKSANGKVQLAMSWSNGNETRKVWQKANR